MWVKAAGGLIHAGLRAFGAPSARLFPGYSLVIPCRVASQPEDRLRFTGRHDHTDPAHSRQPIRTPEPCLQNPTAERRCRLLPTLQPDEPQKSVLFIRVHS